MVIPPSAEVPKKGITKYLILAIVFIGSYPLFQWGEKKYDEWQAKPEIVCHNVNVSFRRNDGTLSSISSVCLAEEIWSKYEKQGLDRQSTAMQAGMDYLSGENDAKEEK